MKIKEVEGNVFGVCPNCGSSDIESVDTIWDNGGVDEQYYCKNCEATVYATYETKFISMIAQVEVEQ